MQTLTDTVRLEACALSVVNACRDVIGVEPLTKMATPRWGNCWDNSLTDAILSGVETLYDEPGTQPLACVQEGGVTLFFPGIDDPDEHPDLAEVFIRHRSGSARYERVLRSGRLSVTDEITSRGRVAYDPRGLERSVVAALRAGDLFGAAALLEAARAEEAVTPTVEEAGDSPAPVTTNRKRSVRSDVQARATRPTTRGSKARPGRRRGRRGGQAQRERAARREAFARLPERLVVEVPSPELTLEGLFGHVLAA